MAEKNTNGLVLHNQELNLITTESIKKAFMILISCCDYENIKIVDICKKAGVSRTGFYKNFTSKDDILKTIIFDFNDEIFQKIGNPFINKPTLSWYVNLFKIIKENSFIFQFIIKGNFVNMYIKYVNEYLTKDKGYSTRNKNICYLWNGAIESIVIEWITQGMNLSIEELSEIAFEKLKYLVLDK